MYSHRQIEHDNEDDHGNPRDVEDLEPAYAILDPQGDEIAVVYNEGEAEALVSHLNR